MVHIFLESLPGPRGGQLNLPPWPGLPGQKNTAQLFCGPEGPKPLGAGTHLGHIEVV